MKKSELFKIFKEYFDEEIRQMIREEVNSALKKRTMPTQKAVTERTISPSVSKLLEEIGMLEDNDTSILPSVKKKTLKKPTVSIFKNDNMLGQLLNETAAERMGSYEDDEEDDGEYPTFDRRLFTSKAVLAKEKQMMETDDVQLTEAELKMKREIRDKYMSRVGAEMRNEMAASGMKIPGGGGATSAEEMVPEDRQGVRLPEELEAAFTKDYSQIVKSFKKKK